MAKQRIADMNYSVFRRSSVFTRRGYLLIIYRHDKDGRPFLYHTERFYGQDGRKLRSQAIARGKALQSHFDCYRDTHILAAERSIFASTGFYIP